MATPMGPGPALLDFTTEECGMLRGTVLDLVSMHKHEHHYISIATVLMEALNEIVRRNAAAAREEADRG
jgi:hypothetical protein